MLYENKYDDSYYKRYFEILKCIKNGEYSIYNLQSKFSFSIIHSISPRKMFAVIEDDLANKPKNFFTDSIKIFKKETKNILKGYKEYYNYRYNEGAIRYKPRRISFSILNNSMEDNERDYYFLYYGVFGIIRFTTLLISNISPQNFKNLSFVNEEIYPALEEKIISDEKSWEPLMLKLFYNIKDDKSGWNMKEIISIVKKLSLIIDSSYSCQIIAGVLDEIFKQDPDEGLFFCGLEGNIGKLSKKLQSIATSSECSSPDVHFENSLGKTEKFKLIKLNTQSNNDDDLFDTKLMRSKDRKKTFHKH